MVGHLAGGDRERRPLYNAVVQGGARGLSASWCGHGAPRQRRLRGLRGRPRTLELRHGPDSYGRQQWGILGNGRKADPATPRVGGSPSGCKPLSGGTKEREVNNLVQ